MTFLYHKVNGHTIVDWTAGDVAPDAKGSAETILVKFFKDQLAGKYTVLGLCGVVFSNRDNSSFCELSLRGGNASQSLSLQGCNSILYCKNAVLTN